MSLFNVDSAENKSRNILNIGKINIDGDVVVSDPYYPLSDNKSFIISNIEYGKYLCMVKYIDGYIDSIMLIHESINLVDADNLRNNWKELHPNIITRDGMMGIFNFTTYYSDDKYKHMYNENTMSYIYPPFCNGDIWYNVFSAITLSKKDKCIIGKDDFIFCSIHTSYKLSCIVDPNTSKVIIFKLKACEKY